MSYMVVADCCKWTEPIEKHSVYLDKDIYFIIDNAGIMYYIFSLVMYSDNIPLQSSENYTYRKPHSVLDKVYHIIQ